MINLRLSGEALETRHTRGQRQIKPPSHGLASDVLTSGWCLECRAFDFRFSDAADHVPWQRARACLELPGYTECQNQTDGIGMQKI